MNKRIQELAEQADDYAKSEYDKWIPTPDFSGVPNIRKIFNEKFAELIVAECLEACSRANEIRHFVPPTQEQVVYTCMREIEETFRS